MVRSDSAVFLPDGHQFVEFRYTWEVAGAGATTKRRVVNLRDLPFGRTVHG